MDEELIKEVEHHAVIYNRQKYFLNNAGPVQYETKDEAWNTIAIKLRTDVETCKKRWKYLRERYVQQLKQGVPPTFEHLSRPYLEKMKFLDQHIQPRKSYRNVSNFLPSPNGPHHDYMDSRSNGSMQNNNSYASSKDHLTSIVKFEPESFHSFTHSTTNNTPPNNQHRSPPLSHHSSKPSSLHNNHQQQHHQHTNNSTPYSNDARDRENEIHHIPSSSSSLKSPLSSPQATDHHQEINENIKRARLSANSAIPSKNENADSSDNEDVPLAVRQQQQIEHSMMTENDRRRIPRISLDAESSPASNDLLYSLYQRFAPQNPVRCSEQLLGELVTSELLKMSKERRKIAQRRILEVLFFDD